MSLLGVMSVCLACYSCRFGDERFASDRFLFIPLVLGKLVLSSMLLSVFGVFMFSWSNISVVMKLSLSFSGMLLFEVVVGDV